MAGLQRSAMSFRRQGSSGLVWDDKLISGELNQKQEQEEQEPQHDRKTDIKLENDVRPTSRSSTTPSITIERNRSNGGQRGYRTGRVSPAIEPPSPRVSACGFCGAFGKRAKNHRKKAVMGRSSHYVYMVSDMGSSIAPKLLKKSQNLGESNLPVLLTPGRDLSGSPEIAGPC
ncbi:hypothetical protein SADUNF_Sadunf03G0037600 [Salix dunnii]|uniref:MAPK kinase substrate protein n=1 Tax=Salix dunnii TaxID=1413687 RepID=A0A835KH07_9ROSI|nr:hypothetical protein SADUNF_Sadunf03G0037600 [Salix dunnii]